MSRMQNNYKKLGIVTNKKFYFVKTNADNKTKICQISEVNGINYTKLIMLPLCGVISFSPKPCRSRSVWRSSLIIFKDICFLLMLISKQCTITNQNKLECQNVLN